MLLFQCSFSMLCLFLTQYFQYAALSCGDSSWHCSVIITMLFPSQVELCFISWPLAVLFRLILATCAPTLPGCTDIREGGECNSEIHRNVRLSCTNQLLQLFYACLKKRTIISENLQYEGHEALTLHPTPKQESRHATTRQQVLQTK